MKTCARPTLSVCFYYSLLVIAAMLFCVGHVKATELLINGNFNDPSSGSVPTGWTSDTSGNAWVNHENDPTKTYDGSYYLNIGSGWYSGSAKIFQTIAGAPEIEYTLSVESGADAWWQPTGKMTLFFLDSSGNEITNATRNTVDPIDYGYTNDIPHPWSNYTMVATSPAGTAKIEVEFASAMPDGIGGSIWFENASLTAPINPPVIANVYPNGNTLLQGTNKLTFTATSAMPIDATGVKVVLDGVDVSSNLVVAGAGTTSVSVSYTGLIPNRTHTAAITVTDTANLNAFATVNFDTYSPLFSWEAEDYDYNSGQFVNAPILSSTPTSGSYFGVMGVEGVDYHDYSGDGSFIYRSSDTMDTEVTGDKPRQNFMNAGVSDYQVGYFDGAGFVGGDNVGLSSYDAGEWVNYTRDFPAGTYNIIGRLANGNGGTASVPLSMVTSGWGTSSQAVTNLGSFVFPANGWGNFAYVPLTDKFGNRVQVTLSGTNTLRVTAGSGANLNFFMLVAVDTEPPMITGVYPDGGTLLQGTNKMVFTVSSASHSIAQSNVIVTLNGVTNHDLTFSGNTSNWNVSLPLSLNVLNYTAVIRVTDDAGNSRSITRYFDTFDPSDYAFEAEDFDFNGGQYIDNPVITSVQAPDSYFDQASISGVDSWYGDVLTPFTAPFRMRSADTISTDVCSDTKTRALVAAQQTNALAFNYNIAYWATNGWLNYTHNYPAGSFRVYARLAGETGLTNQVQLDLITNSTTAYLGTFTEIGRGYSLFDWIPLINTNNGQPVTVTLDGLATLSTTSITGNVNPNSYLLVPAVSSPVPLHSSYSAGVLTLSWADSLFHLQSKTNSLSGGLTGGTWGDYPGGASSPVTVNLDNTQGAVFFRLSN